MAFLAVLREGFETAVFLLAAFNESANGASAAVGAVLGLVVAVLLGYGIYRGGVRINLSKFFRATGLVLVLVAAGLVVNALHTAHEAGWQDAGQGSTVDLSWLVSPGSVQASLLTGMLGIQSHPVVIEVIGWLIYVVPVGLYVAWPPGRSVRTRTTARVLLGSGVAFAVASALVAVTAPAVPTPRPATTAGSAGAQVQSVADATARVRTSVPPPGRSFPSAGTYTATLVGAARRDGVAVNVYIARRIGTDSGGPARLSLTRIAELNGGRLPIGVVRTRAATVGVAYSSVSTLTVWIERRTSRVLDLQWRERISAVVLQGAGRTPLPLSRPVADRVSGLPATATTAAAHAARADKAAFDRRSLLVGLAWTSGVLALIAILVGLALAALARSRGVPSAPRREPVAKLVRS
jgi:high-affinity iron transporter